ncbi:MAG: 4Fe-4S binding protein [candidate division WOR-3 bacterium]|nr:4Fe-4S binding protein [candidate division WOR-3 bacterium]
MRKLTLLFWWLLAIGLLTSILFCTKKKELPQPKTYYVVDTLRCTGCGVCVDSCRFNAIKLDTVSWKAHIDTMLCTLCGVCKRVCRYQAIKDTTY